jgi:serine phosphatase RsbU (regulator of sigma subunit)
LSPSLRAIRWRLIFTSAVALIMALGAFYLNQWVYAPSDDQCTWKIQDKHVLIQEILPNGVAEDAGLLEGDELLLIHGRKVEASKLTRSQRFINDQPQGRILVYTVLRDGRTLRLPVRLIKPFDFASLIILLSGLVAWGVGLLVVISSPSRKIARHFYYMGVVALLLTLLPLGVDSLPFPFLLPTILMGGLAVGLAPPLWLHFFLRFPHPFALRTHRNFLAVLYGVCLGRGLLMVVDLLIHTLDKSELFMEFLKFTRGGAVGVIISAMAPLVIIGGLVIFWLGTLRQSPRRRGALLPALIFTTAIVVDLMVYEFFLLRSQGQSLLFARESWVFFSPLPLLPLSFAYAIFRHGFFDVRRAILRWITYFAVLGLTLVAYLGGLALLFAQGIQVIPAGWVGALVGLSALPIGWVLRALLLALRRKFRRDLHTAREVILGNLRETKKRFSESALLDGLVASLREAFRPQVLLLVPVEGRSIQLPAIPEPDLDDPFHSVLLHPQTLLLPSGILRHARENRELVLGLGPDETDWINEQGPALRAHVDALEAQVLTLIMVNDEPHSALLLGGKYAELNYGRDDRELLREVAIATGLLIETAVLHRRLLDQGRIEQELNTARLIQESLITSCAPSLPGFHVALRLAPALETGGDLLWVGRRPNGLHLAAVGDVSGKGLAAALYMSQATALLKFMAGQEGMPFELILPSLDQALRNLMGPKDFLTLSLLEWDEAGQYRVARAGHPPILHLQGGTDADATEIDSAGRGLGLRPYSVGRWQVVEGQLEPRQWLVMYSDGLTEAMNHQGELYGVRRLKEQVQRLWGTGSVRAACEAVFHDVTAFESQNRDDRTLFILARDSV